MNPWHIDAQPLLAYWQTSSTPLPLITLEQSRLIIQLLVSLLAVWALVGTFRLGQAFARQARQTAWRTSLKLIGTWLPLASLGIAFLFLSDPQPVLLVSNQLNFWQSLLPLMLAIQAALVFAVDDEPALEILLALPRSIQWLILERLAVAFMVHSLLATLTFFIVSLQYTDLNVLDLYSAWLAPAIFLSGVAVLATLRARQVAFGAMLACVVWFIMASFADYFMIGVALVSPLHLIQPFLWAINLYASPSDFAIASDYVLNRLTIVLAGIALLQLALAPLANSEALILDTQARKRSHNKTQMKPAAVPRSGISSVRSLPRAWHQILAIAQTELRIQRQRRPFKVVTLTLIITMLAVIMLAGDTFVQLPGLPPLETLTPSLRYLTLGNLLPASSAALVMTVALFIMPVLFADSVALDVQHKTHELLGALPIPEWVYLLGKLLGFWLTAFLSLSIGALGTLIIWGLKVGSWFNPLPYLQMVYLGGGFIILLTGSLAILLGATQASQRRAALLVVAVFILGAMSNGNPNTSNFFNHLLSPLQMNIFIHYLQSSFIPLYEFRAPDFMLSEPKVFSSVLTGSLQVCLIFGAVCLWRRRAH